MNTHFATSQRNDMRPLAFEGLLATDCHSQLQSFLGASKAFLAQHGMPDAQLFLAEPMHDNATGKTDWYTPATEKPVPLAELPEAEQEQLLAKTSQYIEALTALAQRCAQKNSMAASLLTLATKHPGKEDIYSAGGTPVLINWGFEESAAAHPEQIVRLGEKAPSAILQLQPELQPEPRPEPQSEEQPEQQAQPAPEPAPEPQPVPVQDTAQTAVTPPPVPPVSPATARSYTGCLPFLLPLLLALLLIWLLLAILGLVPSPLPASCFHQVVPAVNAPAGNGALEQGPWKQRLDSELARSRMLAQKADNLIDRVREHQAMCVPKEAPKPAVPAPQTPPAQLKPPLAEPVVPQKPEPPQTEPVVPQRPEPPQAEPVVPQEQPEQPQEEPVLPQAEPQKEEPEMPAIQPEEKPAEEPVPPKKEPAPLAENEMPDFSTPVVIPEEEKKPEPRPRAKPKAQAENKAPEGRPEAKSDSKPEAKPRASRQRKGEAMQIPKDAAKNNDLSFLEGCWRSVTDLYNSTTGERVEMEYCFSGDGSGRRTIRQRDGDICSGPANARFSGSRLDITAQEAYCHRGGYVPHTVQCKGTEQSTRCHGKEKKGAQQGLNLGGGLLGLLGQTLNMFLGGSKGTWDATFIRK